MKPGFSHGLPACLIAALLSSFGGRAAAETCPLGPADFRPLVAAAAWACEVDLPDGATLHGHIEQEGVDLAVTLLDSEGDVALEVDDPTGRLGLEIFHYRAHGAGNIQPNSTARLETYQLVITAPSVGPSGRFRLDLDRRLRPRGRALEKASTYQVFRKAEKDRLSSDPALRFGAEAIYTLQVPTWLELGEPLLAARALRRLGERAADRGDFEAADHFFARALPLYRAHDRGWERVALLLDHANTLRYTGHADQARQLLEEALIDSRRVGNLPGVGAAFDGLGILAMFLGRSEEAGDFFLRALELWEELGAEGSASTLHNLGLLQMHLGDFPAARGHLKKAEALRRRGSGASLDLTLGARGWLELLAGDYRLARSFCVEALALQTGDSLERVSWLELLGRLEETEGRLHEARRLFEDALDQVQGRGNHLDEAMLSLRLAHLATRRRTPPRPLDLAEGRQHLETAFTHLDDLGSLENLQAAHGIAAEVEILAGNPTAALAHLESALELVEAGRGALAPGSYRVNFFARHRDLLDALTHTLLSFGDSPQVARALEVSEQARGRSLLDEVAGIDWRQRLAPDQRQREQASRERLNARAWRRQDLLARQLFAAAELEAHKLQSLELEHHRLQHQLRRSIGFHPATETLDAAGIQALLDEETVMLSFHWTADRVTLFWTDPQHIEAFPITSDRPPTELLERRIQRVLETVSETEAAPTTNTVSITEANSWADELSFDLVRNLLGPISARLTNQRLVIIADGPLLQLPFAALVHPAVPSNRPGEPRTLLVDRHEIVHLPSASLLAALRQRPLCSPTRDLALFADAVYRADDPRLLQPGTTAAITSTPIPSNFENRETLSRAPSPRPFVPQPGRHPAAIDLFERLPATAEEARSLLDQFPSGAAISTAFGLDVDRQRVLSTIPTARYIHFATHGFFDPRTPDLSGLVLSLFDPRGRPVDGILRGRDIAIQSLCAEQVVLSACRSGLGIEQRGEGLLGLTHAFFLAGARSVVSAHWDIDDTATAELMARYYRALLRDHLPPPAALRQAQLGLRHNTRWKAPAYWAGFSVQGDWR